jgi:hypothetical protein
MFTKSNHHQARSDTGSGGGDERRPSLSHVRTDRWSFGFDLISKPCVTIIAGAVVPARKKA